MNILGFQLDENNNLEIKENYFQFYRKIQEFSSCGITLPKFLETQLCPFFWFTIFSILFIPFALILRIIFSILKITIGIPFQKSFEYYLKKDNYIIKAINLTKNIFNFISKPFYWYLNFIEKYIGNPIEKFFKQIDHQLNENQILYKILFLVPMICGLSFFIYHLITDKREISLFLSLGSGIISSLLIVLCLYLLTVKDINKPLESNVKYQLWVNKKLDNLERNIQERNLILIKLYDGLTRYCPSFKIKK